MIIAAGDSFVYGSELPNGFENTFACKLGATMCIAWPGYGNDAIARTVIETCEGINDKLIDGVLVSWSFPGRYEFRFNYNTGQRKTPWYSINPWTILDDASVIETEFSTKDKNILYNQINTINRAKLTGVHEFAKIFYQHVGSSEYWEIYSSLKEIIYLQNYLDIKNIPYMFTCADNNLLENFTSLSPDLTISSLFKQINMNKWFLFPAGINPQDTCSPRGFYQWAVENKYPMGTTHPLEEAHKDAAKLMKDKFNELVKKSIQSHSA